LYYNKIIKNINFDRTTGDKLLFLKSNWRSERLQMMHGWLLTPITSLTKYLIWNLKIFNLLIVVASMKN